MGVAARAVLYVARKRARSAVLFLILFSMALLTMLALVIRAGAATAAEDVRKSISTGIEMELAPIPGEELYELGRNDAGELTRTLTLALLTQSRLDDIAGLDGVNGYFIDEGMQALFTGLDVTPAGSATLIEQMSSSDPGDWSDYEQQLTSNTTAAASNGFLPVADSRWHPFFTNGALELVSGRHVANGDQGKAVISDELAKRNGLAIGDTIHGRNFDPVTGEVFGGAYEAEIVGLFHVGFEQELSDWTDESQVLSNVVFTDPSIRHWSQVQYNTFHGRDVLAAEADRLVSQITVFVDDPAQLDRVRAQLLAMEDVDWSHYSFDEYDADYKAAAGPLLTMVGLSTGMSVLVFAGVLAVLALILTMRVRERRREIGILVSLGVSRRGVITQLVVECLLIGVVAIVVGAALALPSASGLGTAVENLLLPAYASGGFTAQVDAQLNLQVTRIPSRGEPLAFTLTGRIVTLVAGTVLATIMAAVAVASARIVRLKPLDILVGR